LRSGCAFRGDRSKPTSVRINKMVDERERLLDEPLIKDEVRGERVPVNRFVKRAAGPRREGVTLIMPLFEE
jgi:stress response protein YsnF